MESNAKSEKRIEGKRQRAAIASPLRLEILGLFTSGEPLSISDMATLMNRAAASLYHHVGILEEAGFLQKSGTRPKGKRYEALYIPTASRFEYDTTTDAEEAIASAVKVMATSFRMAERDLEAALSSGNPNMEGADPNFYAFRLHLRASPERLAKINEHISMMLDLMKPAENETAELGPDDQHVSLTLALLPIKGRGVPDPTK